MEDIGFADPEALRIFLNAKEAFEFLGQPDGDLFLTEAAVYLALVPKSNSLYILEKKIIQIAEKYKQAKIPWHIINPSDILAMRGAIRENLLLTGSDYVLVFRVFILAVRIFIPNRREKSEELVIPR